MEEILSPLIEFIARSALVEILEYRIPIKNEYRTPLPNGRQALTIEDFRLEKIVSGWRFRLR